MKFLEKIFRVRKSQSAAFIRAVFSIFSLSFCLLGAASAQSVEKIKPNEINRWVVDGYEIYVDIHCDISRTSLLPTKWCRHPFIVINKQAKNGTDIISSNSPAYFNLIAQKISLGDKWMFDGNDDPMRKVPISDMAIGPQRSEELFSLLMSEPNTRLKFLTRPTQGTAFKTRIIILSDFKQRTDDLIKAVNHRYDQEEATARRNMLIGLIVVAAFLAITLWLAIFLIKRGRKQLKVAKQLFGVFNGKKNREILEKKERSSLFFYACRDELQAFVSGLREKDTASIDECIQATVNAKLIYELFRNIEFFGAEAREFGVSITGETVELMSEKYNISCDDAGKFLSQIFDKEIRLIKSGEASSRIFGSVSAAYKMSTLIGFDQVMSS